MPFDGRTSRREGVLDAVLFLELDLSGCAHLDDSDTAGQLGETLLQLLAIPVRVGVLDLCLDLGHTAFDVGGRASASTMVVSSLVTTTLRAEPSRLMSAESSFRPTSSAMT